MAFGGTYAAAMVAGSQLTAKITGATLAASAVSGTIGLYGDSGASHQLPAAFKIDAAATLEDQIEVEPHPALGTTSNNFVVLYDNASKRFTITNADASLASGTISFYVRAKASIVR